jgi:hypothetical protein
VSRKADATATAEWGSRYRSNLLAAGLRCYRGGMAEVDGRGTDPDATNLMSVASTDREPNRWAVLALLGVAQLMVVLDATIVTIAIPSAQKALHFSTESRQWIVTAYALAFGSLLLLGGKLGDLFGRKWTLVTGLVGSRSRRRSVVWHSPSACSWPPERFRGHSAHSLRPRRWGC